MKRLEVIRQLHDVMAERSDKVGVLFLTKETLDGLPRAPGVYVFLDPDTPGIDTGASRRAIRIGITRNLRSRLGQHFGSSNGGGNHRSSAFRLHIGRAMIKRSGEAVPTWAVKPAPTGARAMEAGLEQLVSAALAKMPFVWFPTNDRADAGRVEESLVRTFSNYARDPVDPPDPGWLGHDANARVAGSGLWNDRFVGRQFDPDAVRVLRQFTR